MDWRRTAHVKESSVLTKISPGRNADPDQHSFQVDTLTIIGVDFNGLHKKKEVGLEMIHHTVFATQM